MVELTPELVVILCYTAFALFLSLYYVPFKIVPKAWAKAVKTEGHPAQVALDGVLDSATEKMVAKDGPLDKLLIEKLANFKPDLSNLVLTVNFKEEFKTPEFQDAMQIAFKSAWAKRGLGAVANEEGVLTPEQQAELDGLVSDPDGKARLVAAENVIDAAVNQKLLKPATAKALKKQLGTVFANGGDIEAILEPYRNLFARFTGTAVGGGGHTSASAGPGVV